MMPHVFRSFLNSDYFSLGLSQEIRSDQNWPTDYRDQRSNAPLAALWNSELINEPYFVFESTENSSGAVPRFCQSITRSIFESTNEVIEQLIDQILNQLTEQPFVQSINESTINQELDRSIRPSGVTIEHLINHVLHRLNNNPLNQSIAQSINQPPISQWRVIDGDTDGPDRAT